MRLYVIGNGFDIRHNLPTGYKHFKEYVAEHDRHLYDAVEEYMHVGDEWNELESALGDIDYYRILDNNEIFLVSYSAEDWSEAFHHDYQYEVERITRLLSDRLKELFTDWVKKIDIDDAHNSTQYIPALSCQNLYFSFNYTNTLQQIYSIPDSQIKHIHGNCFYDDDLRLGHDFKAGMSLNLSAGPDQDTRISEAYDSIDEFFATTFKPVSEIINEESNYFLSLKDVDEVYVLGHSLASVDGIYFSKIKESIKPHAQWKVALYRDSKRVEQKSGHLEDYGINSSNIIFLYYEDL